ncbi:MAG: hypothetical protein WAV85_15985 [Rhodoferax sp.]
MHHRKTLARLTLQVLESMSDNQLQAIANQDPHDLTGLTDAELAAITNDMASPSLLARIKTTLKPKATTP